MRAQKTWIRQGKANWEVQHALPLLHFMSSIPVVQWTALSTSIKIVQYSVGISPSRNNKHQSGKEAGLASALSVPF